MAQWKIDPDHSVATFTVKHFMITDVHGQFNRLSGIIEFDPRRPAQFSLTLEVDAAGIYTGIAKRDEHLRSADFLDVEHHPKMSFISTQVERIGFHTLKLTGDAAIRGVQRQLLLDLQFIGPVMSPLGGETCMSFALSGRLRPEEFNVHWNKEMADGGFVVGKEVAIGLALEADLIE